MITFVNVGLLGVKLLGGGFIWMTLYTKRLVDGKDFEQEGQIAICDLKLLCYLLAH